MINPAVVMVSIYDKLLVVYIMLCFMVPQVLYQAIRFKNDKTISHNFHAILYGAVAIAISLPFALSCGWLAGLKLGAVAALLRLAFFDLLLNFVRGKKPLLTYNGRGTTGSVQDKIENLLPPKYLLPMRISYIVLFFAYTILIK